eukprot:1630198-Alexandrium_andersonii.AAC.1
MYFNRPSLRMATQRSTKARATSSSLRSTRPGRRASNAVVRARRSASASWRGSSSPRCSARASTSEAARV